MKKNIILIIVFLIFPLSVQADIYVKENLHFDAYYCYGRIQPEEDDVNEWWFGDKKVTFLNSNWRISLDKENKRMIVVNLAETTFVEMPLPLKYTAHIDEALTESLERFQINGKIKKTGQREKIDQKLCDVYILNEWITYQNNRRYDCERRVMATTDVPFDWQLVNELHQCIRIFFNPEEAYLKELNNIKGFVCASNNIRFYYGAEVKWSSTVLEISKNEAPNNIYDIPEGFEKKARFTISELMRLRGLVYIKR